MKRLAAVALALVLTFATPLFSKNIGEPKGFDKNVYQASMALYASSESRGSDPRFICTVTAFDKQKGGYLLIGAGHCTSANYSLPSDLTYGVADNLGGEIHPIKLIKSVMDEPLDYAVFFYPTKKSYPVIPLGDESQERIGNKTLDVNFSLGAAKMVSEGVISSTIIGVGQEKGFYLVAQFDSHGASGSAVVSKKTHKIIGLVIAGWDGATMPTLIEPITSIEKELEKVDLSVR